ncbi:MAG TPA: glycosyltransferase [Cellvibrionaceae bacterium]|nr:glycosyltransferase [Cellvibrionaceae bacterium]
MVTLISICIPTLNRCGYLCKALNSVFQADIDKSLFEICISNNASDHDYSAAIQLIASMSEDFKICYIEQPTRLSIDEHMMAVKNLASSPYVYFLGDDDFFIYGQLPLLVNLINDKSPDLAIFNGILVNKDDKVIGSHFKLPPRIYVDISQAFWDLRDKGMFGAVLVKRKHLIDENFKRLFGTAHGYGCYWFSLFSSDSRSNPPVILIPEFPLVSLRMAEKNYNLLEVYYRDIPYELAVYQRYLNPGLPQLLNLRFKSKYFDRISSLSFLAHMFALGVNISELEFINPGLYKKNVIKIHVAKVFVLSGAYRLMRRIYKFQFGKGLNT